MIRTRAQALAEAVRRWGTTGAVQRGSCFVSPGHPAKDGEPARPPVCVEHGRDCPGGRAVYSVGLIALGMFFSVKATGDSWDHAFKVADWRAHEDSCKYDRELHPKRRCRFDWLPDGRGQYSCCPVGYPLALAAKLRHEVRLIGDKPKEAR